MPIQNSVVAVYRTHTEADQAVKELQEGGVDMHKLSIVGKGYHTDEHAVGYYNTGDRMKYWGKIGAFWGGFWGMLFGSAFFLIPGLGPILAAGPVVCMDRRGARECGSGRRGERTGSGSLFHGNSQRQHYQIRNRTQDGSVSSDRPRNSCRGGEGEGHHRNDSSGLLLKSRERSNSRNRLAFPRIVWAGLSRGALDTGMPCRRRTMPGSRKSLPGTPKRIGVAADHGGFELKEFLVGMLRGAHYELVGTI